MLSCYVFCVDIKGWRVEVDRVTFCGDGKEEDSKGKDLTYIRVDVVLFVELSRNVALSLEGMSHDL